MSRSLKKGPYIFYKLERRVIEAQQANKKVTIKTWSRASMISPDFVGQTIAVHNGKTGRICSYPHFPRPRRIER